MDFRCQVGLCATFLTSISVYESLVALLFVMHWFGSPNGMLNFLSFFFFCEGGDSQMDALIWYSWLGGVIIGTMIGANMVLEEHCRAGPRNVVITGR